MVTAVSGVRRSRIRSSERSRRLTERTGTAPSSSSRRQSIRWCGLAAAAHSGTLSWTHCSPRTSAPGEARKRSRCSADAEGAFQRLQNWRHADVRVLYCARRMTGNPAMPAQTKAVLGAEVTAPVPQDDDRPTNLFVRCDATSPEERLRARTASYGFADRKWLHHCANFASRMVCKYDGQMAKRW
jgi:hypothetical protein